MSIDNDLDFSGAGGAEASAAYAAQYSSNFDRLGYLSLGDGHTCIGRFLNDAYSDVEMLEAAKPPRWLPWITVKQHGSVPTKPAPADNKGKWPPKLPAVCRHDKVFKTKYNECFICDHMRKPDGKPYEPSPRSWMLMCLREEVVGTPEMLAAGQITQAEVGQVLGVRDKMKEVKKTDKDGKETGEVEMVREVVIVNLGYKNFFSILEGFAGRYKTIMDRDYQITRKGTDTATVYHIVPLDPIRMDDGRVYDMRDPEFMAIYNPNGEHDIRKIVADRASDEFYGRFFDTRVTTTAKGTTDAAPAAGPAAPTPAAADMSEDRLAALRQRVKSGVADEAPAATEAPAAAPAAEASAPEAPAPTPEASAPAADAAPAPVPAPAGGLRNFS